MDYEIASVNGLHYIFFISYLSPVFFKHSMCDMNRGLSPDHPFYMITPVKKFFYDKPGGQIVLASESTENIPPIFIHAEDKHMVSGIVKNVLKNSFARDWEEMQESAGQDALDALGPISKADARHYHNLKK